MSSRSEAPVEGLGKTFPEDEAICRHCSLFSTNKYLLTYLLTYCSQILTTEENRSNLKISHSSSACFTGEFIFIWGDHGNRGWYDNP